MTWKLICAYALALLVLPGTVLVFVPWAVSILAAGTSFAGSVPGWQDANAWAGTLLFALGFALAGWTNRLFLFRGGGTPAPWDPPRRFVVHGPYRHVRNPMMLAVYMMLAGEALAFASPAIAAWLAAFMAINAAYIPLSEERGLRRRFGADYETYCENVPRWWPRRRPWMPET